MPISFSCPKCSKVLKAANPIPAGKNVKCSACGNIFPMPASAEDEVATGIQAPREAGPPGRRASSRADDAYEDDDRPRRSRRGAEDDDAADDFDDDRLVRRGRGKKGSKRGLMLGIGGGVLLLLILVITGFVWPGFFLGGAGRSSAAANKLLAFAPAGAEMVMGMDLTTLRSKPNSKQKLEQALAQAGAPPGVADLLMNADLGVMALNIGAGGGEPRLVIAVTSSKPIDVEKTRQALSAGPAETLHGKSVYRSKQVGRGRAIFAFPDPTTLVVSSVADADFVQVLDKKNSLPADLQAQLDTVSGSQFWLVVNMKTPAIQQVMQMVDPNMLPLPGLGDAINAAKRSKFVLMSADQPRGASMRIGLECNDAADAGKLESTLKKLWEEQGKPFAQIGKLQIPQQPGMHAAGMVIDDVIRTLTFSRRGNAVFASVELTENTVNAMEKMQNMPFPGGGLGGF